jgi:hypothetical protein
MAKTNPVTIDRLHLFRGELEAFLNEIDPLHRHNLDHFAPACQDGALLCLAAWIQSELRVDPTERGSMSRFVPMAKQAARNAVLGYMTDLAPLTR